MYVYDFHFFLLNSRRNSILFKTTQFKIAALFMISDQAAVTSASTWYLIVGSKTQSVQRQAVGRQRRRELTFAKEK